MATSSSKGKAESIRSQIREELEAEFQQRLRREAGRVKRTMKEKIYSLENQAEYERKRVQREQQKADALQAELVGLKKARRKGINV